MSGVQMLEVASDDDGVRLDRWFRRNCAGLTQGRLEKLLRTGQVRVDGKRAKSSTRLVAGQTVRVPPFDAGPSPAKKQSGQRLSRDQKEFIQSTVIYRDDDVIALNKPPGLAVQGGTRVKQHIDGLLDGLLFGGSERPKLVHRLDRDTSGVLLLARNSFAAAALAQSFRQRETVKTYWAFVAGVPRPRQGEINLALEKSGAPGNERVRSGRGRRAVTRYAVIESAGQDAAWLALYPETGRTHQLRAHCAAIETPIIGDRKYGGSAALPNGFPNAERLHLHARRLEIAHPRKGSLSVEAKPPAFLTDTMKFFGFDPRSEQAVPVPERD